MTNLEGPGKKNSPGSGTDTANGSTTISPNEMTLLAIQKIVNSEPVTPAEGEVVQTSWRIATLATSAANQLVAKTFRSRPKPDQKQND